MLKFDIRRGDKLIAGELGGNFRDARVIEFTNEYTKKDLSGLILPQDNLHWSSSDGREHTAVVLKVVPLFPEEKPQVGKGALVTLDHEIPTEARE